MLYRGMKENGEDVQPCHYTGTLQKQWLYETFRPDVVLGVGYWKDTPDIILHPQKFNLPPVPWFIADGLVADYHAILSALPLVVVPCHWVRETYQRDGVETKNFVVIPIGLEPEVYRPVPKTDQRVKRIRHILGVQDDEILLTTIGGDVTSKGAQEVLQALKIVNQHFQKWKYVLKIWGGGTAVDHRENEQRLIRELGEAQDRVSYQAGIFSRDFMSYFLSACDIYVAPSRLEGFGMIQVEAQSCGIPVVSIDAMGPQDTIRHGQTGYLARVAKTVMREKKSWNPAAPSRGLAPGAHQSGQPIIMEYHADPAELAHYLLTLMTDAKLRQTLGTNARAHVIKNFEYHKIARTMAAVIKDKYRLS